MDIIETKVFARIPDIYRNHKRNSKWVQVQRANRPTECFLEGPAFDRLGNLYVVDVPWGRVFRVSPDGVVELVTEYDGEPNGLKIHKDGRVFIADYRHGLMLMDPATGAVVPYLDRLGVESFKGLNDLFFSDSGDLYFTDQGLTGLHDPTGRLLRLRTNGQLDVVLDCVPSPNGLVVCEDQQVAFVNATRDNAVWRVPMTAHGMPFKVGAFVRLSGGGGPDGLAIDEAGNLAVAHVGFGVVWLFDRRGELRARINSCAGTEVTNIAYGGVSGRTLYITEAETGQILVAELAVPGRRMFSHI